MKLKTENEIRDITNHRPLQRASLTAGLSIFIMVLAAPFAELYAYPKLLTAVNSGEAIKNLIIHKSLFALCISGYALTFICDITAAWALYILLKPTKENLSVLAAWFRIAYAIIAFAALFHLIAIFHLLDNENLITSIDPKVLNSHAILSFSAFRSVFSFSILLFSLHLILLGYLAFVSKYIHKVLGVLLIISGLGYLLTSLKPLILPNTNIDFAVYTFYGELIFMIWLIFKGVQRANY